MPTAKKAVRKPINRANAAPIRQQRASREQETWDNIDIHKTFVDVDSDFGPFPNIPARDGFVQRWIRVEKDDGSTDGRNISRQSNEYWRRRDPDTIPTSVLAPTGYTDGLGETIQASGYVLMERPMEIHDAKKRRVEDRTKAQSDSVEQSLFKTHTSADHGFGAPHSVENKSVASKGSGIMPVED